MTSVLCNPRVTGRERRLSTDSDATEIIYDIAGSIPADINPPHHGYSVYQVNLGWSDGQPPGWVVFNSYCVWIGKTDHFLVDTEHEIDARKVYPDAESAVAAVLAALAA